MIRKIVFAGLRHGHVNGLFNLAAQSPELEITAIGEEDSEARNAFLSSHPDYSGTVYVDGGDGVKQDLTHDGVSFSFS